MYDWVDVPLQHSSNQGYKLKQLEKENDKDAITVIAVHGHLACFNDFEYMAYVMALKNLTVYSLDFDGEPSAFSPYIVSSQAGFLSNVLAHICKTTQSNCHILAHSIGGLIALEALGDSATFHIHSLHLLSTPLVSHPAPLDPSWGAYYAKIHDYLKSGMTTPLWAWTGGIKDTIVPWELTVNPVDITFFRRFVLSALPGVYKSVGHVEIMFLPDFALNVFLPALEGFMPSPPVSFSVNATQASPFTDWTNVTTGCNGIGPVKLLVSADCPFAVVEMVGLSGETEYCVSFQVSEAKWLKANLIRFNLPTGGFAAAQVKLEKLPISVLIPDGVTLHLRGFDDQRMRRVELPVTSISPILKIATRNGAIGSDGQVAARNTTACISASAGFVWSIGDANISHGYLDNIEYISIRHWPTVVAFAISSVIIPPGRLSFLAVASAVVIITSCSVLYVILFLLGYLARFILIGIVNRVPVMRRRTVAFNAVACIAYPQLGLWVIAAQFSNRRMRALVVLLAVLKILSFLALLAGLYHLIAGDLKPGLAAVLTPAVDPQGWLLCILPLFVLYRSERSEVVRIEDAIIGTAAAAFTSAGFSLYWQALFIQLALIPLTFLVRKPRYLLIGDVE